MRIFRQYFGVRVLELIANLRQGSYDTRLRKPMLQHGDGRQQGERLVARKPDLNPRSWRRSAIKGEALIATFLTTTKAPIGDEKALQAQL